jgi:hypothetical protein
VNFTTFVSLTLLFLPSASLAATASKDLVSKETRKPLEAKWEKVLETTYKEIYTDYADIISAYKKVKEARPSEYSFYLDKLKDMIIEAVEANKLEYKDLGSRAGYALFTRAEDQIEFSRKPLLKCSSLIIPKSVNRLSYNKRRAKNSPFVKDAETLMAQLKDIKTLISR